MSSCRNAIWEDSDTYKWNKFIFYIHVYYESSSCSCDWFGLQKATKSCSHGDSIQRNAWWCSRCTGSGQSPHSWRWCGWHFWRRCSNRGPNTHSLDPCCCKVIRFPSWMKNFFLALINCSDVLIFKLLGSELSISWLQQDLHDYI